MLEDRPILQRALVAVGAFGFVFSAAMAGTAFMLTGGFGYADENNPSVRSPDYGYEFAFVPLDERPERPTYVEAGWTQPSSFETSAPPEAWDQTGAREDLEGEADAQIVSLRPDTYDLATRETEDVYAQAEAATAEALESYAGYHTDYPPMPAGRAEANIEDEAAY